MSGEEFVVVPGLPTIEYSEGDEFNERSIHSQTSKQRLKDAMLYCQQLLEQDNLVAQKASAVIGEEAMLMGEAIFNATIRMLGEKKFVVEDELIMAQENGEEDIFEVEGSDSPDEYEPPEKTKKLAPFIPIDYKRKVVNLATEHPKWTLRDLQKNGCSRLKSMNKLRKWREHVKSDGTKIDKYSIIDSWTNDRFIEARENSQQVTTRNLQQWALAAAGQFDNLDFKAALSWVMKFNRRHQIRQRKITKYVSESETATLEETLAAAESFRDHTRELITKFDQDFVINTNQIGCQYQSTFNRTLAERGSKVVLATRKDMNKVTHSYTAQYTITLSGKLLPFVFICLQEATGSFGIRVKKSIEKYREKYTNVVVTPSKSGKLTTVLYKEYLTDVLRPYVKTKKFLLIIDSWEGQTNPGLYDEVFKDDEGRPSYSIKVIPPKCTSLVQPCDVYFYRQVKNLIKRIQNCAELIEQQREITSREDCMKIHSIVHHQLSSPIFSDMLRYAWFACKLTNEKHIFLNVNEVCFPIDVLKTPCGCKKAAFIRCARCRTTFCFTCFYDEYHSGSCESTGDISDE